MPGSSRVVRDHSGRIIGTVARPAMNPTELAAEAGRQIAEQVMAGVE